VRGSIAIEVHRRDQTRTTRRLASSAPTVAELASCELVAAVETVTEAMVSIQRIERFLNLPEPNQLPTAEAETAAVVFRGGTFEWDADADASTSASTSASPDDDTKPRAEGGGFQLKLGHFSVEEGELIGICGPVGSGKSSLLAALLAEITPTGGADTLPLVRGTIAYCAQQPWIIAGTLRDNILFGLDYDPVRYHQTLEGCALVEDISALPGGDLTELGERGINLSGGQKVRWVGWLHMDGWLGHSCEGRTRSVCTFTPASTCPPNSARWNPHALSHSHPTV
jgi:ATP-binding cassette subfamily C (CFTR/MRP) protein 1